ncbi:MAG TPA: CvpA family protein [Chloroflexia bacterium]|nr:CvpA family protein [Chloroflexia bacterium]
MNWVDITILGLVTGSTLLGLFWGLIRQLISVGGLVGGIFFAGRFYGQAAELLHGPDGGGLVADPNLARITGFAAIVILFSLLLGAIGSVLRMALNLLFLGWLDHVLGALLGLITSLALVMSLLAVATVFPAPDLSESIMDSWVAQGLNNFVPVLLPLLPDEFQLFHELMRH